MLLWLLPSLMNDATHSSLSFITAGAVAEAEAEAVADADADADSAASCTADTRFLRSKLDTRCKLSVRVCVCVRVCITVLRARSHLRLTSMAFDEKLTQ